ncbi:MAG TPA: glycosyltransferase [Nitrospirae bacterium]|nr:glycosyltransferase [Nitrospirota bacterium]
MHIEFLSNPLVSIIVRTKDRPELLLRALSSIANCNYQNKEIIIVNDGGCDINKEKISNILKGNSFNIYVNKSTLGRAESLNKGINNAKGELIYFLDDDDTVMPDGISSLVNAFGGDFDKIIYGNVICRKYTEDGKSVIYEWIMSNPFEKEKLVLENFIPINSLCIPKKFLSKIGAIDPAFLIYEDWDMLLRLSEIADFIHITKTIAEYSIFGTSTLTGKEGFEFQKHYRQKILKKHFHKVTPEIIIKYIFFAPHIFLKDNENERLAELVKELNNQLANANQEKQLYKDQLDFYNNTLTMKISELNRQKVELQKQIKDLKDTISIKNHDIANLKKINLRISNELRDISNSRSWKVTRPIRVVMKKIRKYFRIINGNHDEYKVDTFITSLENHKCQEIIDRTKEKVEIIIVNYNGLAHLKKCIPSVMNTNYPNFSVTVVDNNSTDGSVEYLEKEHPHIKIIKNKENIGFGRANDIAIQQSEANLIALLNNDTEVEPNWLSYLVCYLMNDDTIASTTSKLLLMKHPSVINNVGGGMNCLGFGYDLGLYLPDGEDFSQPKEVLFPSGAACLIRKNLYFKIGGFDKTFFMYHEDVDLGWRFWNFGYKVIFVPQSRVYHAFGGTSYKIGGHSFKETYGLQHAMRSLIKNYEFINMLKYLSLFIALCIKKYPSKLTSILKWNLKLLPSTIKERHKINKNKRLGDATLFNKGLIDSFLHPFIHLPDYEMQHIDSFIESKNERDSILMGVNDICNLGYGWHRSEIWHKDKLSKIRCTMSEAVVFLYNETEDDLLTFEIASLGVPIGINQSFCIFVNDNQVKDFIVSDDAMKTYEVPLQNIKGILEIRIKVNKTFIPDEYYHNGDKREIGLAVKSIRIIPKKCKKVFFNGISVIMPTYNRVNELIRTLKALEEQTLSKNFFEVIIVDDGSKDDTAERVKDFMTSTMLDIKYYRQDNSGPATARNLGIKKSKRDLIVFLGDDTTPASDFLKIHFETHLHKNTDSKIAVLGYTGWPEGYKITPFLRYINGYGAQFGYELIQDGEFVNFSLFYTSNISLPKALLNRLDYNFDEQFSIAGWEDTDIGYRLQQKGMNIFYNEKAKTQHFHKINILTFCKRQFKIGNFSKIMYSKHPELYSFLNLHRAYKLSRHKPIAFLLRYFIYICDALNISLPHRLYSYVLNVYYSIGYLKGKLQINL